EEVASPLFADHRTEDVTHLADVLAEQLVVTRSRCTHSTIVAVSGLPRAPGLPPATGRLRSGSTAVPSQVQRPLRGAFAGIWCVLTLGVVRAVVRSLRVVLLFFLVKVLAIVVVLLFARWLHNAVQYVHDQLRLAN